MTKVTVTIDDLRVLAERARDGGNMSTMLDIALEFAQQADDRVRALEADRSACKDRAWEDAREAAAKELDAYAERCREAGDLPGSANDGRVLADKIRALKPKEVTHEPTRV